MKLGVQVEAQEGVGWQEWKNLTQWAEELGFESVWRSDHLFSFGQDKSIDALESMVALTYTASHSSRVRFGPIVLSMTFRHPAMLARMAAAIDNLSGGRLVLGLGAGWNVPEHEAFGIELPPLKQRMDRLEEGVQVIKAMLTQDYATFKGKIFQVEGARATPRPVQSPLPIMIGGGGEKRTLRMVARYADEWNMPGGLERYREKAQVLEAHCEAEKRDPASIDRSLMMGHIIAETQAEVDERLKAAIEHLPPERRPEPGRRPAMIGLAGTPPQVIEQIKELEAEGVSRIMLQHFNMPSRDSLELIAKEILPRV